MRGVVRNFKANIVGARFVSPVTVLIVLLMRIGLFFGAEIPTTVVPNSSFLGKFLLPFFEDSLISFLASTVSIFIISWLLSHLNNRFTLLRSRSNLPFILPLFLFSLHPVFLQFSVDYISIFFIILAFFPLLDSYQKYDTQLFAFKSSILIAFASLFQIYAIFLFPLFWRGEFSMRGFHFRSLAASFLGVILVYWCTFCGFFFFDYLEGFWQPFIDLSNISFNETLDLLHSEWVSIAITFFIFITYIVFLLQANIRDKVLTQIVLRFIVFLLIILFLLQLVYWQKTIFMFLLGLSLFAFLIAYLYSASNSKGIVWSFYVVAVLFFFFYFTNFFPFLSV